MDKRRKRLGRVGERADDGKKSEVSKRNTEESARCAVEKLSERAKLWWKTVEELKGRRGKKTSEEQTGGGKQGKDRRLAHSLDTNPAQLTTRRSSAKTVEGTGREWVRTRGHKQKKKEIWCKLEGVLPARQH